MNNLKRIFWVLALIITSIILLPSNVKAIEITERHGEKGEFLKQLAIYIKERNK